VAELREEALFDLRSRHAGVPGDVAQDRRQRPDPQRSAKGDRHLVLTPTVVLIAV